MTPLKNWLGLLGWLSLCFGAAGLGAWATTVSVATWYPTLAKPSWNPPNWLFGPVWTLLYAMMAVAAWLVWRRSGWTRGHAWFLVQLALNALWSAIFFGLHRPGWAFAEIVLLWASILMCVVCFWPVSRVATGLLLPYLAWVSFAAVLNGSIWILNR